MGRPQQIEIGLKACGVGESDPAQGADVKAGGDVDQPSHRLYGFVDMTQTGATEREDAVGEG